MTQDSLIENIYLEAKRLGKLQEIIENDADLLNKTDNNQETLLFPASKMGDLEIVDLFLKKGACPNKANKKGRTPLHIAVEYGHNGIVIMLLSNGANVNAIDKNGKTALHIAAEKGNLELIEILDEYDADPDITDNNHCKPVNSAIQKNHINIANEMSLLFYDLSLLCLAAKEGSLIAMRELLNNGLDIDETGSNMQTPLSMAASNGHLDILTELLERGADTSIMDENQEDPLFKAVVSGQYNIIKKLLTLPGVNINTQNNAGTTPLIMATFCGNLPIVDLLLSCRAIVDQVDHNGYTSLHYAIHIKNLQLFSKLLKSKADIKKITNEGGTVLQLCLNNSCDDSSNASEEILKTLLRNDKFIIQKNDWKWIRKYSFLIDPKLINYLEHGLGNEILKEHALNQLFDKYNKYFAFKEPALKNLILNIAGRGFQFRKKLNDSMVIFKKIKNEQKDKLDIWNHSLLWRKTKEYRSFAEFEWFTEKYYNGDKKRSGSLMIVKK